MAVVCRASIIVWSVYLVIFVILTVMIVQYEHRLEEQDTLFRESLDVFSSFVDAKDPYTYGHSRRVAYYSGKIAQQLGLPRQRCEHIYYIAMLHDIGKCYVPDEILKKPSALTPEEYAIVKQHPLKGAGMVRALRSVPEISDGVLYHHERYDGTRLSYGEKGNGYSAGRPYHRRGRRIRCHEQRPRVPQQAFPRGDPGRAAPRQRYPV